MKTYDILIIGGGPAGITICKKLGNEKKIAMIRPEDYSMIYCAMPYAIEKLLPIEKTFKQDSLVTESGAELIRDHVTEIDFPERIVTTGSGEQYAWEKLVIATGATPVLPPIPGHDLPGVMTFKTEKDLRAIISKTEDSPVKDAVIVGAGAIGVELAQALNTIGINTHLVDMADHILPAMVDKEMAVKTEAELISSGITLHLGSRVTEIQGKNGAEEVHLDNGKMISLAPEDNCERSPGLVVFAVGMKVDTSLFEESELETGPDGIIVNSSMETSIPGVYAAGDCVQFHSGVTGEVISGKLATNAVPMAKVLASVLKGGEAKYNGFYNGAATKVGSYFIGGTGLTEKAAGKNYNTVTGTSELTTMFPNMPGTKKIKLKLVASAETGRILGGQVLSGEPVTDRIDTITLAIQQELTAADLADLSYSSQPWQSFFPANNLIVAAAGEIEAQRRKAGGGTPDEEEALAV